MGELCDKNSATHYRWGDNCDCWVLTETEGLSVKQERMPAGTREQLHFHARAQQFFFILRGEATFYIAGKKLTVSEQQGIRVQPKVNHFIANETEADLDFLVISEPSTRDDRITVED